MTNELIERYVLSIFEGEENIIDRRDGRLIDWIFKYGLLIVRLRMPMIRLSFIKNE